MTRCSPRWRDKAFGRHGNSRPRAARSTCTTSSRPSTRTRTATSPDGFCLSVGTFFYRGQIGRDALARFHADFEPDAIPWHDIAGQFCLIVAKHGAVHLLTDRIGLYKTYRSSDASVVSSSFLAVAAAADRLTIDWQSLYEYVLLGATYGNRTVFDEIAQVDPDAAAVHPARGGDGRRSPCARARDQRRHRRRAARSTTSTRCGATSRC